MTGYSLWKGTAELSASVALQPKVRLLYSV